MKLSDRQQEPHRNDGRRFLRIFALSVLIVAALVATVNLVAYRYMLRPENQAIVQLLSGWGRMYKPILYDEIQPNIAVFGASWARDAFDPVTTGALLDKSVFNHAVSGGTAYETRRFADASLDNPKLQAAIVNLDTFFRNELVARVRYGFDESILDVDAQLRPNRFVGLRRIYSLALSGWAAGSNLKLISTIRARDAGVARPDYLEAYEQANHTRRQGRMDLARKRIFPQPGEPVTSSAEEPEEIIIASPDELEIMLERFCAAGIDVHAYFTPSHVRQQSCDLQAVEELTALALLRRKQVGCNSRIHYYHFGYPNAVTLEGVLSPVRQSTYYRPDGHPRPTMGLLMAARMFRAEFPPGTQAIVEQDFGVDLLTAADAEGWLLERAARCEGDWGERGYDDLVQALTTN